MRLVRVQGGGVLGQGARPRRREDAVLGVLGPLEEWPHRLARGGPRRALPVPAVRPHLRVVPRARHPHAGLRRRQHSRQTAQQAQTSDGDEAATTSRVGRGGTERDADGGRDGDDANGGDGEKEKKEKKEKKRKRVSKKASDAGRAPKRLRDPDAHLEYLARWSEATQERGDRPPEGFKPANGWKLDKNVQNWLIRNACDASEVDDDAFAMFLLYAAGLRGGPLERMRDAATGESGRLEFITSSVIPLSHPRAPPHSRSTALGCSLFAASVATT